MIEPQTLRFLATLKKNNNKDWFEKHRNQYEAAKINFSNFIQLVIEDIARRYPSLTGLNSKDCIFRINRDVRFSKDKSPYKINFGASMSPGGKKSKYAGFYFHLEPSGSFAGGGLWRPEAADLKVVRQEIDYNWDEFKKIIESKAFKNTYTSLRTDEGFKLLTVPAGYAKENPASEYLKHKTFVALTDINDSDLTKATLHAQVVEAYRTLLPLIIFINNALGL